MTVSYGLHQISIASFGFKLNSRHPTKRIIIRKAKRLRVNINEPTPTQGYGVSMGNNLMIDSRVGVPGQGN